VFPAGDEVATNMTQPEVADPIKKFIPEVKW
jgi:hypothetical protein